jgi:hypothetical protein
MYYICMKMLAVENYPHAKRVKPARRRQSSFYHPCSWVRLLRASRRLQHHPRAVGPGAALSLSREVGPGAALRSQHHLREVGPRAAGPDQPVAAACAGSGRPPPAIEQLAVLAITIPRLHEPLGGAAWTHVQHVSQNYIELGR